MADISISKSRGKKYLGGSSPMVPAFIVGDDPDPLNPPGTAPTTLFKLLGDVTDRDFIGKNGFVPVVNDENLLTLEPLPQLQENGLISGGIVQWTGIGYVFNVSGAFYRIGGVSYESQPIQITLATPDVTNDRIDVFAVSTSGVALAITGTPSGSPIKPQINPQTQLELTSVIVGASTSTPTLTEEVIYDENTEWTGSSTGTGTVAFNSAVDPYQGSVSINATNIENGLKIRLTDGSDYDLSTVQTLGLQINLKATMGAGQNIGVTFLNSSGGPISTELILNHDKTLLGYQFVGIALNQFTFTSFNARSVEFRYIRTKGTIIYSGYFLDIIKLEGGINPPLGVSSFLGLSDTPSSYSGQGGKTVAVKSDESGLEFVTGGGITGSGTTNELAYFTGASSIGSLAVATYPSLTELSYVKGVTSAVQTQINGKQATIAGTLTDTYVATIVAGVPTWAVPAGGSSNWTVVGSDIYRDSSVAIGRTTIPSNSTFAVQSRTSNAIHDFFVVQSNAGTNLMTIRESSGFAYFLSPAVSFGTTSQTANQLRHRATVSNNSLKQFLIEDTLAVEQFSVNNIGAVVAAGSITGNNFIANGATGLGTSGGISVKGTNDGADVFRIYNSTAVLKVRFRWSLGFETYGANNLSTAYSLSAFNNSSTRLFGVRNDGALIIVEAGNFVLGTTTGTKIGTATSEKLAFWNKTPIIQPTTGITGATRVGGGGTTITDTDTFGGYTIAQLAAILINTGLTA